MCGIAGVISKKPDLSSNLLIAEQMQKHRGPDKQARQQYQVGCWTVGLCHQRLAIIDLSDKADQPMVSWDGSKCVIYNGEIYNYIEIRAELQMLGCSFKSVGDTEVLLKAIEHWGLQKAQERFNGMWAYAFLDKHTQKIVLSRDRAGVKPLYYFYNRKELFFASEIKTILAMTGKKFLLNDQAVEAFLTHTLTDIYPETMFRDVYQLPAGHLAEINLNQDQLNIKIRKYWQPPSEAPKFHTTEEVVDAVRTTFLDSVKIRLRSDVPVGVLLSGGVDSSAIACAIHNFKNGGETINLLSAVSNNHKFDESRFIDMVGNFLKRDIYKVALEPDPRHMFDLLEKTSWLNDEPITGFSTVLHYLLMEKARELNITVILSGQGADELLCGYKKYLGFYVQYLLRKKNYSQALKVLHEFFQQGTIINQFDLREAKRYLPNFLTRYDIDIRGERLKKWPPLFLGLAAGTSIPDRQVLDLDRFSVPVLTHYEDRMSMAWGREIRLPFLDYRLMELLIPLSAEYKLQKGWTKYIFRQALKEIMPPEIVWRKDKRGFINSQVKWMSEDLKGQIDHIFSRNALVYQKGLVDKTALVSYYKGFSVADNLWNIKAYNIFSPFSLEIWLKAYNDYIE